MDSVKIEISKEIGIPGLKLYIDELERRMLGRALHFPADHCANCDLRRAIAVLDAVVLGIEGKIEL